MKHRMVLIVLLVVGLLLAPTVGLSFAQKPAPESITVAPALGTAFTYQGRLTNGGNPANGQYDFQFKLYAAASGGSQVGSTLTKSNVQVSNGLFTVQIDFGNVFNGQRQWLEVAVRPAGSGSYTTLSPRQELTAAPNALYSLGAPWSGLAGVPAGFADNVDNDALAALSCANGQLPKWNGSAWACGDDSDTTYTAGAGLTLSGGAFSIAPAYRLPQGCTNGQVAKWNGGAWACGDDNAGGGDFWALTGNSGVNPSSNFLGTTDNQPLEIRVNNQRALRIEPGGSPNIIGGYSGNSVANGVAGATIGGGGHPAGVNYVMADFGTIGGGFTNTVSAAYATVGGGLGNTASGVSATIGGGWANTASGIKSTVGGGDHNTSGDDATVGGGMDNEASGVYATVGGGYYNDAAATYATIAGGGSSDPNHPTTTNNRVTDDYGTVGGGGHNQAGNGDNNTTNAQYATVSGGVSNEASAAYSTVGGGRNNTASGSRSTISGGENNTASGYLAAIGGGFGNTAGFRATVAGGDSNTASGSWSAIPGGSGNQATGSYSFAAGRRAKATYSGCFVWGDSTNADVSCNANDRTLFRSSGGFWIYTNSEYSSGVYVAPGGGSWHSLSDRNMKENIHPVDPMEVLNKLAQMPVSTWNYKTQEDAIRHMGPMAQDFYAAFGLGDSDKAIATVDAEGVALTGIRGLYQQNQEQAKRIDTLNAQNAELQTRLETVEAQNAQLQAQLQAIEAQIQALSAQLGGGGK